MTHHSANERPSPKGFGEQASRLLWLILDAFSIFPSLPLVVEHCQAFGLLLGLTFGDDHADHAG